MLRFFFVCNKSLRNAFNILEKLLETESFFATDKIELFMSKSRM